MFITKVVCLVWCMYRMYLFLIQYAFVEKKNPFSSQYVYPLKNF